MFYVTRIRPRTAFPDDDTTSVHSLVHREDGRALAPLFEYIPNTGHFHRNDPITTDFYWDHEVLTFEEVDQDAARRAIEAGVGRIDEGKNGWLIDKYRQDPHPLHASQILPDDRQHPG